MPHTRKDGGRMRPSILSKIVRAPITAVPFISFFHIALSLAMSRDGSSGGVIRMCVITEDSVERLFVPGDQLPKFWEGREVLSAPVKKSLELAPMAIE
jgi:20S proteasome subunit beta 1